MLINNIFRLFFSRIFRNSEKIQDNSNFPNHIAFIMDGNRRWAKKNFLPRALAYSKGVDSMIEKIRFGLKNNIKYMTFYCLSKDNLKRKSEDLEDFFSNIRKKLNALDLEKIIENRVLIKTIGNLNLLPQDIHDAIDRTAVETKNKIKEPNIIITLAIGYSSREEIIHAIKKISKSDLNIEELDSDKFSKFLYTNEIPDPDLLIRTGEGNIRLSDFLLWQLSYTELYFTNKYWPEFNEKDLYIAILDFKNRKRNYGK